jgi:hypothetical protein
MFAENGGNPKIEDKKKYKIFYWNCDKIIRPFDHPSRQVGTPAKATDLDMLRDGVLSDRDDEEKIGPSSEQYNGHADRTLFF